MREVVQDPPLSPSGAESIVAVLRRIETMKSDGTDHLHGGAGTPYLEVNSECQWTFEAIVLH